MTNQLNALNERLLKASGEGDALTVRQLLRHRKNGSLDVNALDQPFGQTALAKAAAGGHDEVVRLLLSAGASAKAHDAVLITPLHLAAKGDHVLCVKLLLASGADPMAKSKNNMRPINYSAYNSGVWNVLNDVDSGRIPVIEEPRDVVPMLPLFAVPKPPPEDPKRRITKEKGGKSNAKKKKKGKRKKIRS